MKTLAYYLRIYCKLISQYLKSRMSFRGDFMLGMFGVLASNMLGILSIIVIFKSIHILGGWSYYELVYLYGFFLLSNMPFSLLFERMWHIDDSLLMGDFMLYYFKPLNIMFSFISESIDIRTFSMLLLSIVLMIIAEIHLDIEWTAVKRLFFALFFLGSSLTYLGIRIAAASTAFWFGVNYAIMDFLTKLNDFSRYPISIFTKPLQFIFTFVLPYIFVAFFPVKILLRAAEFSPVWLVCPILGIALMAGGCAVWSLGVRSYTGTGS